MLDALLLTVAIASTAPANPPPDVPTYRCVATTLPVTIDGKLDDTTWANVTWTGDFVDILGPDRPAPPLRTRAKLMWDLKYLYIAAELRETDVRGAMRRRDDPLYRENAFELFLDPDDDGQNYLELQINPLGTIFDIVMSRPYQQRGRKREYTVEGLKSAVQIDGTLNESSDRDRAWAIELAIPWSAIEDLAPDALPPRPGTRMRLNLARTHRPHGGGGTNIFTWSAQGEMNLHAPRRWGYLTFEAAAAK